MLIPQTQPTRPTLVPCQILYFDFAATKGIDPQVIGRRSGTKGDTSHPHPVDGRSKLHPEPCCPDSLPHFLVTNPCGCDALSMVLCHHWVCRHLPGGTLGSLQVRTTIITVTHFSQFLGPFMYMETHSGWSVALSTYNEV